MGRSARPICAVEVRLGSGCAVLVVGETADPRRAVSRLSGKVLVTGHRGKVGRWLVEHLEALGHTVAGFDIADAPAHDLLNPAAVRATTDGCEAVVDLGAIPHDSAGTPERIMAVSVLGTWATYWR